MGKVKWTKELVEKEAKKYNVKNDFARKSSGAYKYALRNDLLKNFNWFKKPKTPMNFWHKETCEKESKKYKTKTEYKIKSSGSYEVARKNGWLNDYTWLSNRKTIFDNIDCIYGYFFENKVVYIGRTINRTRRDKQHRDLLKNDTVFKYSKIVLEEIPEMTILEDGITIDEGRKKEQYWVEYYKNAGYTILNKSKCGGIGPLTFNKYSKEKIINESKKYNSRSEFKKKSPNFYYQALKQKILPELFNSKQHNEWGFWNKKENVESVAKKYEYLTDFFKNNHTAYSSALKNDFLKDFKWLKRKRKRL